MRKIIHAIWLFTSLANNLNAQSWSTVGPGIGSDYYNSVRSLATYNGELYAGGHFNIAGNAAANNIVKWNGTNWSPVNLGTSGTVNALTVYNGNLYAGGGGIAKWNGTSWSNVGNLEAYDVKAFATYNGELYAAGWFPGFYTYGTSIVKWNGNNWTSPLPEDSLYSIYIECMTVYNDELYAAGAYYQIGGGGVADFYRVIKWNGSAWSTVVTIPASYTLDGAIGDILCMTVYNGELYIAGMFGMAIDSNTIALQIAKWNGTNWSVVGTGINSAGYPIGGDSDGSGYSFVNSLGVYNGALYATGRFDSCGSIATNNIAKWDGSSWVNLGQGINGWGYSLLGTDTCLFVGGWFNSVDGYNFLPAKSIAKWKDGCIVSPPAQPAIIYGNTTVCEGSTQTYSIDSIPGATSYSWILPTGWSGSSNTGVITAIAGSNSGEIKIFAINSCGNSIPKTMAVTVNSLPIHLSAIYGNNVVCAGSTVTYSTNQAPGTYYTWNLPQGWIGTSTASSITIIAGTIGGTISVTANNTCGSSNTQILEVTIDSLPSQPGLITGSDSVCQLTSQLYSVNPVNGATSYTWNLPAGWSGISNSNSIIVQAGSNSGSISVVANNNCGVSVPHTMFITSKSTPAMPALIYGSDTICDGSTQTYFIDPVPGATGYAWDLTFGTAFGFDSTAITITAYNAGYPDDFITVSAYNNCGSSDMLMMPVKINQIPYQPTQIFGNRSACSGSKQTYFINTIPDATSYTWVIPSGWIGNSNNSSINVNVGNETDYISVRANNSCGSGDFSSLQILLDSIPAKPGIIKGNVYVATGEKHGYSVDITNRPLFYNWSLNGGGNLIVGQNSDKIEINWQTPGTYVLSVNAVNLCDTSSAQTLMIKVLATDEKDPYHLKLFPNPTSGEFYLKGKRLENKLISVDVFSISGQLVHRIGKTIGANDYSQLIDLDKMPAGIYAVKIIVDGAAFIKQIVIAR